MTEHGVGLDIDNHDCFFDNIRIFSGSIDSVCTVALDGAKAAVELCIGICGVTCPVSLIAPHKKIGVFVAAILADLAGFFIAALSVRLLFGR